MKTMDDKVIRLDENLEEDTELTEEEQRIWEEMMNEKEVSFFFHEPNIMNTKKQRELIKAWKFLNEMDRKRSDG
jgi:metal-dependent HD superfamily phosphatase/phosphodiesterase